MTVEAGTIELLKDELQRAVDENRTATAAELREAIGIGHDDLQGALSELRERGLAFEEAPGEWRGPMLDEVENAAAAADPDAEARAAAALDRMDGRDEDDGAGEPAQRIKRVGDVEFEATPGVGSDVVLTMGIATALGAEGLGNLVAAGITEAQEAGTGFTLRVPAAAS